MGMDKEVADIWLFGRVRPDLTPEESYVANANFDSDSILEEEKNRREDLIKIHKETTLNRLIEKVPEFKEIAEKSKEAKEAREKRDREEL